MKRLEVFWWRYFSWQYARGFTNLSRMAAGTFTAFSPPYFHLYTDSIQVFFKDLLRLFSLNEFEYVSCRQT